MNRIVYIAQALSNDLKFMYIHALGENVDTISVYTKELWQEINTEIDELSQYIIVKGNEPISNPSDIKSHLDFESEWLPLDNEIIDFETFKKELELRVTKYIIELKESDIPDYLKCLYIKFWSNVIEINEKRGFDL